MESSRQLRQVWTRFFLYSFGVFLVYSAFGTLLSLQSSINIKDGLGTTGLASIYSTAVAFSILGVPAILRKYEAKKCVYLSEITYILYTLANFYPAFYTIVPASVVVGIGDSLLWSCFPIMNTFFANLYSSVSGKRNQNSIEARFSGYFFAMFQMAKISGNLISYAILYGFSKSGLQSNSTSTSKSASNLSVQFDYSHCGASDCLDEMGLGSTISQYVPENNWALYVLLSVMALLCVTAVIIHFACIPSTKEFLETRRRSKQKSLLTSKHSAQVKKENLESGGESLPLDNLKDEDDGPRSPERPNESSLSFAIKIARDVAHQFMEPKQWLLIPMCLYAGLSFGFLTSEVTRSYSSCVFGVSWVPIHSLFFGVGAATVCYVTGKLSKLISQNVFIAIAAVSDTSIYLYSRFWNPQTATHLSLIPIYFVLGGMTGGVWIPISQVSQVMTFPDHLDVCSAVWNFWFMGGIGAQFAWSCYMCIDAKIYIQLGVLAAALLGYGISERLRTRNIPKG